MDKKQTLDTPRYAAEALAKGDQYKWFDDLYRDAGGNADVIPWADPTLPEYLTEWLEKNNITGNGKKALVIGCGLGRDAEELAGRGFAVTAFDISQTAVEWTKRSHPDSRVDYHVADLFAMPAEWRAAFDLVVECYTVQALPRNIRQKAIEAVKSVLREHGELFVAARAFGKDQVEDPFPWAIKEDERSWFAEGLHEVFVHDFIEERTGRRRIVCLYRKD